MPTDPNQPEILLGDEDSFYGHEHLRPAWQVVAVTIVLIAASVLVLAITG
jgi:hypothetical protein